MIKRIETIEENSPTANNNADKQKERTIKIYTKLAGLYAFFRVKDGLQNVLDLMEIKDGCKVLDIGTGPGTYALHIAKNWPSCTIHGLDPCERFVEIARKKASSVKSENVNFDLGDAENMHYNDELFDRILGCSVLCLIQDQKQAINEIYRVLKPGGIVVFKDLLEKKFVHKEMFYIFWKLYVKMLGIFNKEVRGLKRSDYEGNKLTENDLSKLLDESPFSEYRVFTKGTRLYGVCRK